MSRTGRHFEALEPKLMLAAVAWDGGGDGSLWSDPLNWSADVLPGPGDDVLIDADGSPTISFTAAAGDVQVRSLRASESMRFSGGSLLSSGEQDYRGLLRVEDGANLSSSRAITVRATLAADEAIYVGGRMAAPRIELDAGGLGTAWIEGTLTARSGGRGGDIRVLGGTVWVSEATIDASGGHGGGTILLGGDYQGRGAVRTAKTTVVDAATVLTADAMDHGHGGKVIVWSHDYTGFYGTANARGGARGGDGGFIETSGKVVLDMGGSGNASAAQGRAGEWLLDPRNVTIGASNIGGAFSGTNPITFTPNANNASVSAVAISSALSSGTSVIVTTSDPTGVQSGVISVNQNILKSGGGAATLTLRAASSIFINAPITSTFGDFSLNLIANDSGGQSDLDPSEGGVFINAAIILNGSGSFTSTGTVFDLPSIGRIIAPGGAITIQHTGNVTIFGDITAGGGPVVVDSGGSTSLAGAVESSSHISLTAAGGAAQSGGELIAPALRLVGSGNFSLNQVANDVQVLAASATGWDVEFTDANTFAVGTVLGTVGIDAAYAYLQGELGVSIDQPVSAATQVTVLTRALQLDAVVSAPLGIVIFTAGSGTTIGLGTAPGTMQISDAELANLVTGGTVIIGNPSSGLLSTSAVTFNNHGVVTLEATAISTGGISLPSGSIEFAFGPGGVTQSGPIVASAIKARSTNSGASVVLDHAGNDAATFSANTAGGIRYTDVNAVTLAAMGGYTGVVTTAGNISITTGGGLAVNAPVSGTSRVTLTSSGTIINTSPSGVILGGLLEIFSSGGVILDGPNDVNTIESVITGAAASLYFRDIDALAAGNTSAVGISTVNGNVTLVTQGLLTVAKQVNVGTGNITIDSLAGATQTSGSLVGGGLRFLGSGTFFFASGLYNNSVTTIAANLTGVATLAFNESNGMTVGTVLGTVGFSAVSGVSVLRSNGNIAVADVVSIPSGQFNMVADGMGLNAPMSAGDFVFAPRTAGTTIGLGTAPGTLRLDNSELANISTSGTILIGSIVNIQVTSVIQTSALAFAGSASLILDAATIVTGGIGLAPSSTLTLRWGAGGITQTGPIVAGALRFDAAALGSGAVVLNNASNALGSVAGRGIGGITLRDTGDLDIVAGSTNGLRTSGKVTLSAPGSILLLAPLVAGDVSVTANAFGGSGGVVGIECDRLWISSVAAVVLPGNNDVNVLGASVSGGASFSFTDVDSVTVGSIAGEGSGITTLNNNVTLNTGGVLTLAAPINAGTGIITLNSAAGADQTSGMVAAGGLRMLGAGLFSLEQVTNDIVTVAASFSGPGMIVYRDANTVSVGVVGGTVGISGPDLHTVLVGGVGVTVDAPINSGTNQITFISDTLEVSAGLTAGNGIVVYGLSGGVTIGLGLAPGTLQLANSELENMFTSSVIIGSPYAGASLLQASAVSVSFELFLEAQSIVLDDVTVNGGNELILTWGAVGVTQTSPIFANSLQLKSFQGSGTGAVVLTNPSNEVNYLYGVADGDVSFTNSNNLVIGSGGPTGLLVNGGASDIEIVTGGLLMFEANLVVGGGVLVDSTNGVDQVGGSIVAATLTLLGTGAFSLPSSGNNVGVIAANVLGAMSYVGGPGVSVGAVGLVDGITTGNGDVALTTGGVLSIYRPVNAGGGYVNLDADSGATLAGGTVMAGALLLWGGGGGFNITGTVGTLAAAVTGPIFYADSDDLSIGAINEGAGIISDGAPVHIAAAGQLFVGQNIHAGAGSVFLHAGTDGVGDLVVGTFANIGANSVTLRAGDGAGGGGSGAVITVPANLNLEGPGGFGTSPSFVVGEQDAPLSSLDPFAFSGGVAGVDLTIRSFEGEVIVTSPDQVAGAILTLNGATYSRIWTPAIAPESLHVVGEMVFLNPTAITTTGAQVYEGGPLSMAGPTGSVTFTGASLSFGGNIAGNFTSLIFNSPGVTTFAAEVIARDIVHGGGGVVVVGANVATAGPAGQVWGGPVTVVSSSVVFDAGWSVAGGVTFNSTLDAGPNSVTIRGMEVTLMDMVSGTGALTIEPADPTQNIELSGLGGGSLDLSPVEIARLADGFASITFGGVNGSGTIVVAGATTFSDPVTLRSPYAPGQIIVNGTLTLTDNASITFIGSGSTVILNADIITNGAAVVFNDSVLVGAALVTIDTTNFGAAPLGAAITFLMTVNGIGEFNSLTLKGGVSGTTTFAGAVGATVSLGDLVTDLGGQTVVGGGLIQTSGQTEFGDDVLITANTAVSAFGARFGGAVLGSGWALAVAAYGNTEFVGDVLGLTSLTTDAPGMTLMGASLVQTSGDQSYGDAVQLTGLLDQAMTSATGLITFASTLTIGARNLTITADEIDFAGLVTGTGVLTLQQAVVGQNISVAGTEGLSLDLTVDDLNQIEDGFDAVVIGTTSGTGTMSVGEYTFEDDVELRMPGDGGGLTIDGTVSGTRNSGIVIRGSGATSKLRANIVTDGGAIQIFDAVILEVASVFIDTTNGGTAMGGNVMIESGINSALEATNTLTLASGAGITTLNGAVGSAASGELGMLTVHAVGGAELNAGSITTLGAQTYNAPVTLGEGLTLTTTASPIVFNDTVDGGEDLTIGSGSGATIFNGSVGSGQSLASLVINTGSTRIFNGPVNAQSLNIYGGLVEFNAPTTVLTGLLAGGVLGGSGNVAFTLPLIWTGGSMEGTGRTIITETSSLTIFGPSKSLSRTIENHGTATWYEGDIFLDGGSIENMLTGSFLVQTNGSLLGTGGASSFVNAGLLQRARVGTSAFSGLELTNTGTISLLSGSLSVAPTGGVFTNSGVISVGAGSTFHVLGDFVQTGGGTFATTVTSSNPVTGVGRLAVSGSASLAGSLAITLSGSYVPVKSDIFDIVTAASRTGTFGAVSLVGASVLMPHITYLATGVRLQFLGAPAILAGDA